MRKRAVDPPGLVHGPQTPGSGELIRNPRTFLSACGSEGHATSAAAQVEVPRTLIRVGAPQALIDASEDLLDRLLRIRLSDPILRAARQFPAQHLRTLDALHLASAEHLEHALTAFVTYDKRLAEAAEARSLPVVAPEPGVSAP
ncbi:type II toxin-antitoxin system VapC family toxin [Kitasatospora sp. NPDC101183]|uniref:type II toxin-antitoxin system VapC family toxin n=1 Tax=Kitasatospora sp. NPDC101183 TaxID=3364100 RepID=UPI00380F0C83